MRNLRSFLRLGVIIPPLPYNIQNGQLVDAIPVMADFNALVAAINANVPPLIPTVSGITAFTPTISFGGGTTGIVYSLQAGAYITVGPLVFFALEIHLSSKGSSTGLFSIDNLPFVVNGAWPSGGASLGSIVCQNITFTDAIVGELIPGVNRIAVVNIISASPPVQLTNTACTNSSNISCSGFYPKA